MKFLWNGFTEEYKAFINYHIYLIDDYGLSRLMREFPGRAWIEQAFDEAAENEDV